jgi:hypothetical protein
MLENTAFKIIRNPDMKHSRPARQQIDKISTVHLTEVVARLPTTLTRERSFAACGGSG